MAGRKEADSLGLDAIQKPASFHWIRVAMLVGAVGAALFVVAITIALVTLWAPTGTMSVTVASAALGSVGVGLIAAGLTRRRRFPGEAFAAGGLILWCLAALSGGNARTWLSVPAFITAWASLTVDLDADTRITVFLAHLMPLDAILDDLGIEGPAGTIAGVLAALYLLALLVVLPLEQPWRDAVAGFAACAVGTAVIVGIGYGTWTWRIAVYFSAVLLYGAVVYFLWRQRIQPAWQPLLLRPSAP